VHFPEIPAADLARTQVNPSSFHPAAAAASDWEQQLKAVVMASCRTQEHQQLCQPELAASSPWELNVAVCPQVSVVGGVLRPASVGVQQTSSCQWGKEQSELSSMWVMQHVVAGSGLEAEVVLITCVDTGLAIRECRAGIRHIGCKRKQ
jgi:hypothetical protein